MIELAEIFEENKKKIKDLKKSIVDILLSNKELCYEVRYDLYTILVKDNHLEHIEIIGESLCSRYNTFYNAYLDHVVRDMKLSLLTEEHKVEFANEVNQMLINLDLLLIETQTINEGIISKIVTHLNSKYNTIETPYVINLGSIKYLLTKEEIPLSVDYVINTDYNLIEHREEII